jgi:hypothetical protein
MEETMKRLLSVLLLMLCLSFPTFAGHTQTGGYACTCGTPGCIEDYKGECDGHRATQQSATPNDGTNDGTAELSIFIVALLFWLRLKA